MNSRSLSEQRDLQVLEAMAADQAITQRALAARLDIAVGLANLYVKRLMQKGFIKCINVKRNRIRYLLTPKGVTEKARLTYEFMNYSMRLYRDARARLAEALQPAAKGLRVCICIHRGTEAAELTYLALRERGMEPAGVLTTGEAEGAFLGIPIRALSSHRDVEYDLIVLATFDPPDPVREHLQRAGIPLDKVVLLTPLRAPRAPRAPSHGRRAS